MNDMYGIFVIMLFYALGNGISWLLGGSFPGSVIGMVLLFLALQFKVVKPEKVKPTASFFMKNMALFYVPVGVGIVANYHLFKGNFWAIIIATVVSTVLVLLSAGLVQQKMERWKK